MDTRKIKEIKGIKEIRNGGKVIWSGGLPGPKKLIGGTMQAGFFGECPASELITGDELASRIGLRAGTSQRSNEPWLKFAYKGNIEFVAKKPFRHTVSWDNINAVNAVFGNRTIKISGKTYKIRLMRGKSGQLLSDASIYTGSAVYDSEWNKLMLPIHKNAPSNWKHPDNVKSPTENWKIGYADYDLITGSGNGSYTFCQEHGSSTNNYLYRGGDGVSYSYPYADSFISSYCGWRPVLEYVKD